jgi:transcriptional regulator with XRE-family HTH domain
MASQRSATTHKKSTKGGEDKDLRTVRVGRAVQVARNLRGLTQRQLAEKVGRSQNYVWLVESAKTDPGIVFLSDVAEKLEVPLELFLLAVTETRSSAKPEQENLFAEGRALLFGLVDTLVKQTESASSGRRKSKKKPS